MAKKKRRQEEKEKRKIEKKKENLGKYASESSAACTIDAVKRKQQKRSTA